MSTYQVGLSDVFVMLDALINAISH